MSRLLKPFLALVPIWRVLLDVIYPRRCRVCLKPLPERDAARPLGEWFCEACETGLAKLEPPFCEVCSQPYDGQITGPFRCGNCADRQFAFEFAVAAYRAEEAVRELVHQFKYGRDLSLRGALAGLLAQVLQDPRLRGEDLAQWCLVPVPLHRGRQNDRGFNQSWELCRRLSQRTGLRRVRALRRKHATEKQSRLTRARRLKNLKGAFAMKRGFRGPRSRLRGWKVLLVDDVFTTGATAHACASVLRREGGAEKVVVIAVARG